MYNFYNVTRVGLLFADVVDGMPHTGGQCDPSNPNATVHGRPSSVAPVVLATDMENEHPELLDLSLRRLLSESSGLERAYKHTFDATVVNYSLEHTVLSVEHSFARATGAALVATASPSPSSSAHPPDSLAPGAAEAQQWVPVGWLY